MTHTQRVRYDFCACTSGICGILTLLMSIHFTTFNCFSKDAVYRQIGIGKQTDILSEQRLGRRLTQLMSIHFKTFYFVSKDAVYGVLRNILRPRCRHTNLYLVLREAFSQPREEKLIYSLTRETTQ